MSIFEELVKLFRDADEYGACHIIVSDGNVDDHYLDFCETYEGVTDHDLRLIKALRAVDVETRERAWDAS